MIGVFMKVTFPDLPEAVLIVNRISKFMKKNRKEK
jgi:hypothetical protein